MRQPNIQRLHVRLQSNHADTTSLCAARLSNHLAVGALPQCNAVAGQCSPVQPGRVFSRRPCLRSASWGVRPMGTGPSTCPLLAELALLTRYPLSSNQLSADLRLGASLCRGCRPATVPHPYLRGARVTGRRRCGYLAGSIRQFSSFTLKFSARAPPQAARESRLTAVWQSCTPPRYAVNNC
jgi:hypothetical protein